MKARKFYQKKRIMIPLSIGLALIFLSILGAIISSFYLTTSNASVEEYLIPIQAKTKGKIIELNLQENMTVKKGEIVAELEASLNATNVKKIEEEFSNSQEKLKSYEDEISKINLKIKQNTKNIDDAKINLENANEDYVLYKISYKDGTVTKKDLDKAIKNLEIAQMQYEEAQAQLKLTSNSLEKIISQKDTQIDEIKILIHELEQAKYELSSATITASKNGIITNIKAKVGDNIDKNTTIATIVPDECIILANFKKLPSKNLKVGQKAIVKIYSQAFKTFEGEVVEIMPEKSNLIPAKIKITTGLKDRKIKTKSKAFAKVKVE